MTYESLRKRPSAFQSLTGMSASAFDALYEVFAPAHGRRRSREKTTRRGGHRRQRRPGAGREYAHTDRDRLLMALVWLKVYPTYEVLGFLFSLNKSNARLNVEDVLVTLETLTVFRFERPVKEREPTSSKEAVMDAFEGVRLVIDAKEQRIQRPSGVDEAGVSKQKPYYSGKKKAHTQKTQVAVAPDGTIEALSRSVPGGANHDLTLLRETKLLDRLKKEEEAMFDKGYVGIRKDYPSLRLHLPHKASKKHPLTEEQKAENAVLSKYRIVVEHTNAQLNKFGALSQVYRHAREKHTRVVRVVAGLVNRQIAITPLKTYLTPSLC